MTRPCVRCGNPNTAPELICGLDNRGPVCAECSGVSAPSLQRHGFSVDQAQQAQAQQAQAQAAQGMRFQDQMSLAHQMGAINGANNYRAQEIAAAQGSFRGLSGATVTNDGTFIEASAPQHDPKPNDAFDPWDPRNTVPLAIHEPLRAELDAARKRIATFDAAQKIWEESIRHKEVLISKLTEEQEAWRKGVSESRQRANKLADETGALRSERDDLLRENAVLRRKLEAAERKAHR